jgi:cysteine desulfurase
MDKPVYFDCNATTPPAPEVVEAMLPFLTEQWGNPSSLHTFGNRVRRRVDAARDQVAAFLGASDPGEIIFTSCGTESNNTAIRGSASAMRSKPYILTSKVEHSAVLEPVELLEKDGCKAGRIGVDCEGHLDLEELKSKLAEADEPVLASFMWANNETGVIFPIRQIAELVHEVGGVLHTDAVQAAGKIAVSVEEAQVDMLSISGHKLYAPKGIGALYVRRGTRMDPFMVGGHQERAKRAGTENVPHIIGLGKACELAMRQMEADAVRERELLNKLESGILERCKGASVNGAGAERLPNTANISFEFLEGEAILMMLDDANICTSTGAACESGSIEASHVLKAMDLPREKLNGSVRFSLGRYTTEADVDAVLEVLPGIVQRLRDLSPRVQD